jgi:protein-tyrosine phosphatase
MLSAVTQFINYNYGSKRGLLATFKYKLLLSLVSYKSYQNIDFNAVNRLFFICSGNIGRSAFGVYMAKTKRLNAVSYGLHCRGGDKADPRAIHEASIRDVDMQNHITRNIFEYKVQEGDLLLVMEPRHLVKLNIKEVKNEQVTIVPLRSDNKTVYLNDLYNGNVTFFSFCESAVEQCVKNIHTKLISKNIWI